MISCPDCNKTYNEKMAECPFCGCSEKPHSATPSKCPRCTTVHLDTPDSDSEGVYSCNNCEGMWVTGQAFNAATSLKTVINSKEVSATFRKPKYKEDPGYLPCSCCGKLMVRENFKSISGIHIDRCSNHGIWLDSGELDAIQSFIASGGIDKSQDRELIKHKDMLTKLHMEMKDAQHDIKMVKRRQITNLILSLFR